MKKIFLASISTLVLFLVLFTSTDSVEASTLETPSLLNKIEVLSPDEFEVYDENGMLLDSNDYKLTIESPNNLTRADIHKKYMTLSYTSAISVFPKSKYVHLNSGWRGTLYYQYMNPYDTWLGMTYTAYYSGYMYNFY